MKLFGNVDNGPRQQMIPFWILEGHQDITKQPSVLCDLVLLLPIYKLYYRCQSQYGGK